MMAKRKREPLKISCTDSECDQNLHCFKATAEMASQERGGSCRSCGIELVDWARVQKRDLTDLNYTFEALKNEYIRHHFFHRPLDQHAVNHAVRKGKLKLREAVTKRILSSVGPKDHPLDGRQTPMHGSVIYYAQHGTASCCRKCIEYWHGINQGHDLTELEVEYLSNLAWRYICERLPDLEPLGKKVPGIRKVKK